jgi:hypothetical protein
MAKLCDYPLRGKRAGATCDRKLCERCAVHAGPDLDYCPPHARLREKEKVIKSSARARQIVDPIVNAAEVALPELQDIVGREQNGPPHGEADGSLSPNAWKRLRAAVDHLAGFVEAARRRT